MKHYQNGPHYQSKEWRERKEKELTERQTADPQMMLTQRFLKDASGWYADVPEHTRSQNAMVAGADRFVEELAGGSDSVTVRFRTVEPPKGDGPKGKPLFTLRRIEHDAWGATYLVFGVGAMPVPAWVCNVTETVLGDHPKRIYIYGVEKGA